METLAKENGKTIGTVELHAEDGEEEIVDRHAKAKVMELDNNNIAMGRNGGDGEDGEERTTGSSVPSANLIPSEPIVKSVEMEPSDDEEDIGDTSGLGAEERDRLFARGLKCEKRGKSAAALQCYMGCLTGLSQETRFVLLPQCLRNIAEIHYQNQEFEKAIHFAQAEKLYYENSLVNSRDIQQKLGELTSGSDTGEGDARAVETVRAEEFEHLAKLCMDKQNPELALEYAGKCTKIRQQLFGENHPKTQESLDFFTTIYAEVGKQQYTDSMDNLDDPEAAESMPVTMDSEESTPSTPTSDGTPVSILRNRKNSEKEKKQVRFHESVVDNSDQMEAEEAASRLVVGLMLTMSFLVLGVLGAGLYCRIFDARVCRNIAATAHDAFLNAQYIYHKYTDTNQLKFA